MSLLRKDETISALRSVGFRADTKPHKLEQSEKDMKKLLLLGLMALSTSVCVNANVYEVISRALGRDVVNVDKIREEAQAEQKRKIKDNVNNSIEKKCLKIHIFKEFFICPPVTHDKVDGAIDNGGGG